MFFHEPSDSADAECRRRLLDHGIGPLTRQVQTIDQIRAELAEQHRRRERATELAKAGLWPLALEELAKLAVGVGVGAATAGEAEGAGADVDVRAEQVKPESERSKPDEVSAAIEDRGFRPPNPFGLSAAQVDVPLRQLAFRAASIEELGHTSNEAVQERHEADHAAKLDDCCAKDTTYKSRPGNGAETAPYPKPVALDAFSPSLNGRDPLAPDHPRDLTEAPLALPPTPKKKRRRPHEVPWHEKRQVRGHKISKTISIQKRRAAVEAYDRAKALRKPFNVKITLNPGTDHLDPVERIRFWDQYLVKLQSYCAARRKSAKKARSWFPCFYILARESDPLTHRGEHAHMLVHAPNAEEAQRLIDVVNGAGKYKGWGVNILAEHADTLERFKGIKRQWALGYLLKASGMQAVRADAANWTKPSGAIAGERVRISENLTSPEVVAKTEVAVETYARVRKEKVWGQKVRLARRRRSESSK